MINFDPLGTKSSKKKVSECRGFNRTFFPEGSKLDPPLEIVTPISKSGPGSRNRVTFFVLDHFFSSFFVRMVFFSLSFFVFWSLRTGNLRWHGDASRCVQSDSTCQRRLFTPLVFSLVFCHVLKLFCFVLVFESSCVVTFCIGASVPTPRLVATQVGLRTGLTAGTRPGSGGSPKQDIYVQKKDKT